MPRFLLLAIGALGLALAQQQPILFTRNYNVPVSDPAPFPMAFSSGGIYIAGAFRTPGADQVGNADFRTILIKYDSSGTEMWAHPVSNPDGLFPIAMAVDTSGIYVAGRIGRDGSAAFVRKYDDLGNQLWSRQFRVLDMPGGYHNATGVAVDASGVYVTAWNGFEDGLLRKYSPAGGEVWTRYFPVRSLGGVAAGVGGLYVTGRNDHGGFLRKYDMSGDGIWTRPISAAANETVIPGIVTWHSSGVYVGGTAVPGAGDDGAFLHDTADGFLSKLDADGNELWTRRVATAGRDYVGAIGVDNTGVYAAGGTEGTLPGQCRAGYSDAFVVKYAIDGTQQWLRQFGSAYDEFPGGVAADANGVYIGGGTWGGSSGTFFAKLGHSNPVAGESRPFIRAECVLNAANYTGGGVAPGEIVVVFGGATGLTELSTLRVEDGRAATNLAGARIVFDDIAAPLLFVSDAQSAAVVPYAVSGKKSVAVQLEYNGVRSDPVVVPVAAFRPAVFTRDGSGGGPAVILNEDGSLNSSENPAGRGSTISVYLTGDGLTDPAIPDGTIVGVVPPKSQAPVALWFDDPANPDNSLPAEIVLVGGVPGSIAGLSKITLRVPATARTGDAVPFYYQIGSEYAEKTVTVALR